MTAMGIQARFVAKEEVQSQFAKARESVGSKFHMFQKPIYKVYVLQAGLMMAVGMQARIIAKEEVQSQFVKAIDSLGDEFHTFQKLIYKAYILQ